jgi:hypothetical protein
MSAEENKALVRRVFEEGWNAGNLELFNETDAPEYVLHDPSVPEDVRGVERLSSNSLPCTCGRSQTSASP